MPTNKGVTKIRCQLLKINMFIAWSLGRPKLIKINKKLTKKTTYILQMVILVLI